ncbi:aconitase X swivel domain-containing protein [Hyperthermus butylicus]|uniref:Universally conserved protein n=1 Tax=Hyperthermus butylicus (strain DSM 5456 / JCM 9403 / PLM1-5) TaxID=415426 RepID=A2BN86_HYPBU|nr:DUF126 domain-containing protein [Hyperthermus butylicus]ABM81447.1 universally conserved protein [Hyperthermus butylicus DSM 5456]
MQGIRLLLRGLVEGRACAPLLIVDRSISFYGEVDPDTGVLKGVGSIAGKILVFRGSRGSTVGPYIMYALRRKGLAPAGLIVPKAEPMLVAGAVLAEIPLAEGITEEDMSRLQAGTKAMLEVKPPQAILSAPAQC